MSCHCPAKKQKALVGESHHCRLKQLLFFFSFLKNIAAVACSVMATPQVLGGVGRNAFSSPGPPPQPSPHRYKGVCPAPTTSGPKFGWCQPCSQTAWAEIRRHSRAIRDSVRMKIGTSYFSSSSSSSCRRRRRFRYPARVHSLSAPAAAGGRVGGAVRPAYFFFFFCPPPIKGARGRSRHAILDPCGYMLPCSSCARIARFSASTSAAVLRSILISSSGIR